MKVYKIIVLLASLIIGANSSVMSKPQDPKEPYPYKVKNITFENSEDGIEIGGTLTIPESMSSYPVVILLNGSGAQDRNSEIFGHKPFWVMADYLSRNGIATLRMDDRGVGETGGNYSNSSLSDFVEDAEFAIEFIKDQTDINFDQVGVLGHSLGGTVATILTSESDDIDFMILLASGGIRGDELMLIQKAAIERKMGMTEEQVAASAANVATAYEIILNGENKSTEEIKLEISDYFNNLYNGQLPASQLNGIVSQLTSPWMLDFIRTEPSDYLKSIDCRVLAINGTNDLQVIPDINLKGIESGLAIGNNDNVTIRKFDKLNHLFQESESGLPQEYGTNKQTISPKVLEAIAEWIKR